MFAMLESLHDLSRWVCVCECVNVWVYWVCVSVDLLMLHVIINWNRCPAGYKISGSQCVNDNECWQFPCRNGGRCRDHNPPKKYECHCPLGFTGQHCELELLASGVLTPSRDFIIALILCISTLIRKYIISHSPPSNMITASLLCHYLLRQQLFYFIIYRYEFLT